MSEKESLEEIIDSHPAPPAKEPASNDAFQALGLFTTYLDERLKSLREDIRDEQVLSANSFKRLRKEREVKFKFNGNQKQFEFNTEVLDELELAEKAVQKSDANSTLLSLSKIKTLIHKRNKLIRIADKSSCGWDTVKEYESDELASDSEDEKKIRQAEFRAQRKKRVQKKSTPAAATGGPPGKLYGSQSIGGNHSGAFRGSPQFHQHSRFHRGGTWPQFGGRGRGSPAPTDLCHACGGVGHWRANCPKITDSAGK
ncbi:uncharacterized protein LOC117320027 [Pecten maximus]|uniref:uncharacterized protein LOC117320027 n=1 Tax=Pecten maximus TaxID=6579 RepID=UPI0014584D8F|nr:uncharacterized protein LOC117320027 [Pecten maximus]